MCVDQNAVRGMSAGYRSRWELRWDHGSVGLVSWLFVLSVGLREVEGENGTRLEGEEGRGGGKGRREEGWAEDENKRGDRFSVRSD
jgi:hypothetical protein